MGEPCTDENVGGNNHRHFFIFGLSFWLLDVVRFRTLDVGAVCVLTKILMGEDIKMWGPTLNPNGRSSTAGADGLHLYLERCTSILCPMYTHSERKSQSGGQYLSGA